MASESIEKFNLDQKQVFNNVIKSVLLGVAADSSDVQPTNINIMLPAQRLFSLDAPGGNRKTFETTEIQMFLQSRGMIVLAVESPAVAAQLLVGGRTAHSIFKVPILVHSESPCHIDGRSQIAEDLKKLSLII